MDNIVSHETIRSHIKSIEAFTYRAGRIFPMLDSQAEHRRVHRAKAFWVFWESAKAMKKKKQIMLVHMDEKRFWSVVKRRHNKEIVSLGIQPIAHKTHHTSHIYKVLGIATSDFLPVDSDI